MTGYSSRQGYTGCYFIDGKSPIVACDVPVQFIMLLKKTKLSVGAVGDFIPVFTRLEQHVFLSDVYPHTVG